MNFSTLLSDSLPYLLPALIVLATALMVTLLVVSRRQKAGLRLPKIKSSEVGLAVGGTASNRRTSLRREGTVEVLVQSPAFTGGEAPAYVVDRSTGGLRLALATGLATGTALQVRAKHAPDTTPWVTVLVRSCRPSEGHFELGCEFEKTPPWNVLLLFG
jgi:PilZ domain